VCRWLQNTHATMGKEKPHINLVVIGHVDSGKSTTTGCVFAAGLRVVSCCECVAQKLAWWRAAGGDERRCGAVRCGLCVCTTHARACVCVECVRRRVVGGVASLRDVAWWQCAAFELAVVRRRERAACACSDAFCWSRVCVGGCWGWCEALSRARRCGGVECHGTLGGCHGSTVPDRARVSVCVLCVVRVQPLDLQVRWH
jgi:hypothetical protein